MKNIKASTALFRAAKLIEECGWCQDQYTVNGMHCVRSAIATVYGVDPEETETPAEDLLARHLEEHCLAYWNDRTNQTRHKVLEVLKTCGAKLKAEGK